MADPSSASVPKVDHRFEMPSLVADQEHSLPTPDEVRTELVIASGSQQHRKRSSIILAKNSSQQDASAASGSGNADKHGKPDAKPKDPDSAVSRLEEIQDFLSLGFSSREALETTGTPQNLAAQWIADNDSWNLAIPLSTDRADSFEFVQRFSLAVLYFALGGPQWNYDTGFLQPQSECLWNFDLSPDDDTNDDENSWTVGAVCNGDGEVENLFLPSANLLGSIPSEIGNLVSLTKFSAYHNRLSGNLPEKMKQLTNMTFFGVASNMLSGSLPSWIDQWTNLAYLALSNNSFTASLPPFDSLTLLKQVALDLNHFTGPVDVFNSNTALEVLFLQNNGFSGKIDSTLFADLLSLRVLDMSGNKLSGTLPAHFLLLEVVDLHNNSISGSIPRAASTASPIRFLSLYDNKLNGTLPESIGFLEQLTHLDLSSNPLTGDIVYSLNNLVKLQYLFLASINFEAGLIPDLSSLTRLEQISLRGTNRDGSIPSWIGTRLTHLTLLDLHSNNLTRPVPSNLGDLSDLSFLLLNQNRLSGTIPETFRNLGNLELIMLDKNEFVGNASALCFQADGHIVSYLTADCGEINCTCCDLCCSDDDDNCNESDFKPNLDDPYVRNQYIFSEDVMLYFNTSAANRY